MSGSRRSRRVDLDATAWVDHAPGWVSGSDEVFRRLRDEAPWQHHVVPMYGRMVDQPRLTAWWRLESGEPPFLPLIETMRVALSQRYGVTFDSVGLNLYRDGRDSVAWHRDRIAREIDDPLVAIVSVGEPRRFLLRPGAEEGAGRSSSGTATCSSPAAARSARGSTRCRRSRRRARGSASPSATAREPDNCYTMTMAFAHNGDVELFYETFGDPATPRCCSSTGSAASASTTGPSGARSSRPRGSTSSASTTATSACRLEVRRRPTRSTTQRRQRTRPARHGRRRRRRARRGRRRAGARDGRVDGRDDRADDGHRAPRAAAVDDVGDVDHRRRPTSAGADARGAGAARPRHPTDRDVYIARHLEGCAPGAARACYDEDAADARSPARPTTAASTREGQARRSWPIVAARQPHGRAARSARSRRWCCTATPTRSSTPAAAGARPRRFPAPAS